MLDQVGYLFNSAVGGIVSNEAVIRACQEKLTKIEQEAEELREHIKKLQQENLSLPMPLFAGPKDVEPGQYRTMKMGTALQAYLAERPGQDIPVSQVAMDLTDGGVETLVRQKTDQERLRRIRICIGNNERIVELNRRRDTVCYPKQSKECGKKQPTKVCSDDARSEGNRNHGEL